jgi:hypothetical protein
MLFELFEDLNVDADRDLMARARERPPTPPPLLRRDNSELDSGKVLIRNKDVHDCYLEI